MGREISPFIKFHKMGKLTERLSTRELELKNQLYSQYKSNKKEFVKNYKDKAEQVMTGRAIKTAKSMASKEQKKANK
jgi:hypothetical protein